MTDRTETPSSASNPARTASTARIRSLSLFTRPPLPIKALPTSNWGLMSAIRSLLAALSGRTGGKSFSNEMKLASVSYTHLTLPTILLV